MEKKNRKTKKQTSEAEGGRVKLTEENLNSHLVTYLETPGDYDIIGMLTYIFKTFKNRPEELLSKIKILTSKKKNIPEESLVPKSVLLHLFAVFDMKNSFFKSLFSFMNSEGILPKIVCEFYFQSVLPAEEVEECLDNLFRELQNSYEPAAGLTFPHFLDEVKKINETGNMSFYETKNILGDDVAEEEDKMERAVHEHNENVSEHSLESLEDEEKIAELDKQLSKIFQTDTLRCRSVEFTLKIVNCIELLVKNNYVTKIEWLWNLLYAYQFPQIDTRVKFIIKDFISKFTDKSKLFKMFRVSAIIIPELYRLYPVFTSYCSEYFDYFIFFKDAVRLGHGHFLVDRIKPEEFYSIYEPGSGVGYDELYVDLINREWRMDVLEKERERELPEAIRNTVTAAIEKVKSKKKRKKRVSEKPAAEVKKVKKSEPSKAIPEEKQEKKRSFAEKVGKKLAAKKLENKKKFRYVGNGEQEGVNGSIQRKKNFLNKKYSKGKQSKSE